MPFASSHLSLLDFESKAPVMSGVGRLKFKGEKTKKKKRLHREKRDEGDELDALAREDPRGEFEAGNKIS